MTIKTVLDDAALQRLRERYEAGDCAKRTLARLFKIGESRLQDLAKTGGWVRPDVIARPTKADTRDREALRLAYVAAEKPLSLISLDFGIHETTISREAARRGWVRPKRGYRKGGLTAPKALRAQEEQRALIAGLYDILGVHIRALGTQGGEAETPKLDQLVRCLKTLHDLQGALGGPDEKHDDARSDDEIRQSVERKLARFFLGEGFEAETVGVAASES
jgi:hypothetical protein